MFCIKIMPLSYLKCFVIFLSIPLLNAQADYGLNIKIGLAKQCSTNDRDFGSIGPRIQSGCTGYNNYDYSIGAYGSYAIYSNNFISIIPNISLNYQYINFNRVDLLDLNYAVIEGEIHQIPKKNIKHEPIKFNLPVHFISSDIELKIELLDQFQIYGGYHVRYAVKKDYMPQFKPLNDYLKKNGYDNDILDGTYMGIGYRYKRISFLYRLLPLNDPFSFIYESDIAKTLSGDENNFHERPGGPMRYEFNKSHEFGIKISLAKKKLKETITP